MLCQKAEKGGEGWAAPAVAKQKHLAWKKVDFDLIWSFLGFLEVQFGVHCVRTGILCGSLSQKIHRYVGLVLLCLCCVGFE